MLKISVVTPSFNQGKFLEETILSVMNQNYPLFELFIIDGGSTDNSFDIIKKYEHKLSGWVSEKDNGQSDAINKGFKMCTGDIVSWLCSDDLYLPGALLKVNETFSSLPESVGVIHGNSEIFRDNKIIHYEKGYNQWSIERQLAGMTFPQPSSFIRRSSLNKVGFLNPSLHYGMDYDLFARLCMICDFKYIDVFLSKYRLHNESKSTIATSKFLDEWILIFNSIVTGLNKEKILEVLIENNTSVLPDENINKFFSGLTLLKKIDYEKMLYYFLINVVRYDYASANFKRVERIGNYLSDHFGSSLDLEPSVNKIIQRARFLPRPFILAARKLKRTFLK